MPTYIGTKVLRATPMTRGEYNAKRDWALPENERAEDEGYLVEYEPDGYISWSPKAVFEEAYVPVPGDLSSALLLASVRAYTKASIVGEPAFENLVPDYDPEAERAERQAFADREILHQALHAAMAVVSMGEKKHRHENNVLATAVRFVSFLRGERDNPPGKNPDTAH